MSYGTLMNNANPLVSALPALLTSFWVATGPNRQSDTVAQTLRQVFITLRDYKVTRGNECDRSTSIMGPLPRAAKYSSTDGCP